MRTTLALAFLLLAGPAACGAAAPTSDPDRAVRAAVAEVNPKATIDTIKRSPIPGLREVRAAGAVVYISEDGKYLVHGDIYAIADRENLTDAARAEVRSFLLAGDQAKGGLRFGPENARHTLYVFTDISCGYCQKFHQEVPALNAAGVAVEYLAYPRQGPSGQLADAMRSIWCAEDPTRVYAAAIGGQDAAPASCVDPIARHYQLGDTLDVQGTPAIFDEQGNQLGGYVTAAEILADLAG